MIAIRCLLVASVCAATPVAHFARAESGTAVPIDARRADIVFLGEQHDNPEHHRVQAEWVAALSPKALVFEMLTPEQAARATPEVRGGADLLEAALGWEDSGWPDFSMYYPIFARAPEAAILGAGVPRAQLRDVIGEGISSGADPELISTFALDKPLPDAQQILREDLQRTSHCNALPDDMLPGMVNVQRLRDAALAQAALSGLQDTGGPVVVITGNGHARMDWGAPFLIMQARPDIPVFALGQAEDGRGPEGGFDTVFDAPAVDRGDPCEAFR